MLVEITSKVLLTAINNAQDLRKCWFTCDDNNNRIVLYVWPPSIEPRLYNFCEKHYYQYKNHCMVLDEKEQFFVKIHAK